MNKKAYSFWDNLFLEDGNYKKILMILLFVSGIVYGVSITDFSQWEQVGFFATAYLLGVPCVLALGDRDGKWGNILGLLSNVGEVVINWYFGAFGMVFSGFYFGMTHILGLIRNKNPKNKDKNGKIKVSKLNSVEANFTLAFLFIGLIAMLFFGQYLGFERDFASIFYWLNIATFVISITSQYLMIVGKKEAWYGWFTSNLVNFPINLIAGNFWFMFRDAIYQVNAIRTIYSQRKLEDN